MALDRGWGVPPVFGENPTRVFLTAVGGRGCSTLGGGFGVVGGRVDIHIRVCISLPVTKGCVLLPPRFALCEQVAVASFF